MLDERPSFLRHVCFGVFCMWGRVGVGAGGNICKSKWVGGGGTIIILCG